MTEARVFRGAVLALLVHALDDAVIHRQPGVGVTQHAVAAVAALVAGGLALWRWPSMRPGLRGAVAVALGGLGLINGWMHVQHVRADAFAASDVTGVVAALAGLVLVGLGLAVPLVHRREAAASRGRRWRNRVLALPVGFLALFTVVPVGMAVVDSHKWREPIPATAPAGYERVTFRATDGLRLHGWFRPSRNGATVVVVHGGNGDRTGAMAHARMLTGLGYGVLVYDARGRGESEGTPSGYGWGWSKDLEGALDHLLSRDDVDPRRIAGLGLSSGGDVLVEVAADRPELRAVIGDGVAGMSFEDGQRLAGFRLETPSAWVMFQAVRAFTGDDPPRPLQDRIAAMRQPLLLVSAGRSAEHDFNVLYERAAGGPVEHWNLPHTVHTDGLKDHPAEYRQRVSAFLDAALGSTPTKEKAS